MLQHGARLLKSDAREQLGKLTYLDAVFKVLEECCDGHAGTAEQPRSAHALRVAFNCRTGRPVNHEQMVALGRFETPNELNGTRRLGAMARRRKMGRRRCADWTARQAVGCPF